jgi:hypothetical protein
MKNIDIKTLTSEEFAMYNTSKLKLKAFIDKYEMLSEFPPFTWNKDGSKSNLKPEFLFDLREELADIDEEDFITDRYVPLVGLTKKYRAQIDEATKIMSYDKKIGKAIKKWFDDNGIEMDESVAYGYGV